MQVLAPLDALRRDAISAMLARPWLGAWLTRRDARLVVLALASIFVALVVTCLLPAAALVLAPIFLGVPHVASDARYLVIRRGLPKGVVVAVAAGATAMLALRVAEGLAADDAPFAAREIALGTAWAIGLAILAGVASR